MTHAVATDDTATDANTKFDVLPFPSLLPPLPLPYPPPFSSPLPMPSPLPLPSPSLPPLAL